MVQECRDRDITISPTKGRVRVHFAGTIIADSTHALNLAEGSYPVRIYIPRADVQTDSLVKSGHHTTCPFKGDASYHHLKKGDVVAENAVWHYPDPCALVAAVKDHVSFWGDDVRVELLAD